MALPTDPETYKYLFSDDIRFLQKAIVMHPSDNKFLIIKRSDNDFVRPGTWDLPGGSMVYGELHQDALKREILEETGLKIKNVKEIKAITAYDKEKPLYYILIGSVCTAISDEVELSEEHSEYKWVTKDEFLSSDPNYSYKENRKLDLGSTDLLRDLVYIGLSA